MKSENTNWHEETMFDCSVWNWYHWYQRTKKWGDDIWLFCTKFMSFEVRKRQEGFTPGNFLWKWFQWTHLGVPSSRPTPECQWQPPTPALWPRRWWRCYAGCTRWMCGILTSMTTPPPRCPTSSQCCNPSLLYVLVFFFSPCFFGSCNTYLILRGSSGRLGWHGHVSHKKPCYSVPSLCVMFKCFSTGIKWGMSINFACLAWESAPRHDQHHLSLNC